MSSRSQSRQTVSNSAPTPVAEAALPSRPFAEPIETKAETLTNAIALQTQVEPPIGVGHRLSDFALTSALPLSASGHSTLARSLPLQPKLAIGTPGDKYEQEADRVAHQVVQRINAPQLAQPQSQPAIQREPSPDGETDLQMQPAPAAIARGETSDVLESAIQRSRSGGHSLDYNLQRQMGQAMGADFRGVRVHTDAQSDQLSHSIQAKAFTTGQDIFFKGGEYNPGSRAGQELIAHELTHVVQQNGSAVQSKVNLQRETEPHPLISDLRMQPLMQRKTTNLQGLPPDIITRQTFGTSTTEKIQNAVIEYNKIPKDAKDYDNQLGKLREIHSLIGAWRKKHYQETRKQYWIDLVEIQVTREKTLVMAQKIGNFAALVAMPPQNRVLSTNGGESRGEGLQQPRLKIPARTIKFNFAGSGEETWKTRKKKYRGDKQSIPEAVGGEKHQGGGKKYVKHDKRPDELRTVVEYAGPLGLWNSGISDIGGNSTLANLEDAKITLSEYVSAYLAQQQAPHFVVPEVRDQIPRIQMNIKGFSRGAATASVFANWIKTRFTYKEFIDANVVLIDPVHGTGGRTTVGQGLMPGEQDVSGIHDQGARGATGVTLVLPVRSGHDGKLDSGAFNPQLIRGYQRIILEYGEGVKHSWGMGEQQSSELRHRPGEDSQEQTIKGMKFSRLPSGLFIVNASDKQIKQVTSYEEWTGKYQQEIEQAVPDYEPARLTMIREGVKKFLPPRRLV